jgi:Spy/CpxP family protein refolding chaperone
MKTEHAAEGFGPFRRTEMRKTFKRIGLGIAAAAMTLVVAGVGYQNLNAQAQGSTAQGGGRPGGPMGRRGPGGPGGPGFALAPMMLERLNLTTDQRDRVRQIMDSHRDEQRALGDRAMKAHQALNDAIIGTFDESAIRARSADVAVIDADMAVAQARVYGEVVQILTSEQQQQLKQLQADMKARAEQMREQRQQGGGRGGPRH